MASCGPYSMMAFGKFNKYLGCQTIRAPLVVAALEAYSCISAPARRAELCKVFLHLARLICYPQVCPASKVMRQTCSLQALCLTVQPSCGELWTSSLWSIGCNATHGVPDEHGQ